MCQIARKSFLHICPNDFQSGLLEKTLELFIQPNFKLATHSNRAVADVPGHTAINVIENIFSTRAHVFFENNHAAIWVEHRFAAFEIAHQLLISEMANTPLRPDQVVLDTICGLPFLQSNVVDFTNAILFF